MQNFRPDCASKFGYSLDNFSGYPHCKQELTGNLKKVSATGDYFVEYDYDKATNSYLRTWGGLYF